MFIHEPKAWLMPTVPSQTFTMKYTWRIIPRLSYPWSEPCKSSLCICVSSPSSFWHCDVDPNSSNVRSGGNFWGGLWLDRSSISHPRKWYCCHFSVIHVIHYETATNLSTISFSIRALQSGSDLQVSLLRDVYGLSKHSNLVCCPQLFPFNGITGSLVHNQTSLRDGISVNWWKHRRHSIPYYDVSTDP